MRWTVRIRRIYVAASLLFWFGACIALLNQWFALRGALQDRFSALLEFPDPASAAVGAAAREVWVTFFLIALAYAVASLGLLGLTVAMRRRGGDQSRPVWG